MSNGKFTFLCNTTPAYVSQSIQCEIRSLPHIFSLRGDRPGLRSDLGPAYGFGVWQYVTGYLNGARRIHGGTCSWGLGVWPESRPRGQTPEAVRAARGRHRSFFSVCAAGVFRPP